MPTYEYKCEQCGVHFDHFQSMTSAPLQTCRDCGGKLRRLIGQGAGIIFKGSGFYCTDYRSPSSASSETQGSKAAEPAAKAETTDTKTDAPAKTPAKNAAS